MKTMFQRCHNKDKICLPRKCSNCNEYSVLTIIKNLCTFVIETNTGGEFENHDQQPVQSRLPLTEVSANISLPS